MFKTALIVIYNHQYLQNIDIVEQIYSGRFSKIWHLMPFYQGTKKNVIPVYESSLYFQGYIAQGLKTFFSDEYDHYFFIADDLLLNPSINETNYSEYFKLKKESCFIPSLKTLHEDKGWWSRVRDAYYFTTENKGVEVIDLLPDYNSALQMFNRYGLTIKPLKFRQIWKKPESLREFASILIKDRHYLINLFRNFFRETDYNLNYPLVGSYSDIFIVSAENIKHFCHFCGIFASTKLFAEFGIPTSLVLSGGEIVTEMDLDLEGGALWTDQELKILDKYDRKLDELLKNFTPEKLYLHPVKLSEWYKRL